ncbi:MAG: hypothetical protein HOC71_16280 [Candidatus Latescibacteria bacterium]|jgi:hypothetical protein|nr:hypothetical protein [Candidatus Latescibacterota bacterium]
MLKYLFKIMGIVTIISILSCAVSLAQDKSPVRISFDKDSRRIDLITGRELPGYKLAERGSFRFFLGRLDKPDRFVNFFHDGVRKAEIKSLRSIEKVQSQFAVWRLNYKSGSKNTPRIHHLAVSFVPLSPSDGEPERRVYLLLNDLELIDWGKDNNN